tara:strand:+ start:987 stop:1184 length:198 start_codon:yes stop_codon:yes gene_type:complete
VFRIDDWVLYIQFPDASTDSLREPKKAVILEVLGNKQYVIWVDDQSIPLETRRRKVNEENLKHVN